MCMLYVRERESICACVNVLTHGIEMLSIKSFMKTRLVKPIKGIEYMLRSLAVCLL